MTAEGGATERGGAFYDLPGVTARYQAHRGEGVRSPNTVMEEPAFLASVGDVAGRRILDLGCGDAAFGVRAMASGASSYLGVDGSREMVELARRRLAGTGGTVDHADLEDYCASRGRADLVVSRLALHYVADVDTVLLSARHALADCGRLVVTVVHPVITSCDAAGGEGPRTSWLVDDYFRPGPRRRTWMRSTVTWHHRPLQAYVRALANAGFALEDLSECAPVPDLLASEPSELRRRERVPLFLLLSATAR